MVKIIKVKIPLGSTTVSYMQKETYYENQQNEIFKIKDVQNMLQKKGPTLMNHNINNQIEN